MTRASVIPALAWSAAAAAWLLPRPKDSAVLGRLDFVQLYLALGLTAFAVAATVIRLAPADRRRLWSMRLLALVLGLGVGTVVVEATMFALPRAHPADNPWYVYTRVGLARSTDLPFVRQPNIHWTGSSRGDLALIAGEADPYARTIHFATDHEGFRNGRDLSAVDIAFVGDSFTEAGNVPEEETFVQRVGMHLDRTVRNLGRAGYSTPEERVVLETFALPHRPREIIWQIAESNDLKGAHRFDRWRRAGRPASSPLYRTVPTWRARWRDQSPAYGLFERFRRRSPWPHRGTFEDREGRSHEIRFRWEGPSAAHQPAEHPGWPPFAEALEQGAGQARAAGARLTVLLVPMKLRVMGPYVRRSPVGKPRTAAEPFLDPGDDLAPNETMAFHLQRLCDASGIRFLDATPALQQRAAAGELVYLPFDTHLSPRGHEVISELIVEALAPPAGGEE